MRGEAHSYQYTFAPNPRWSNLYAPGREIQQYLQGVADRFGATRFIKTSRKIERCEWVASEKKWFDWLFPLFFLSSDRP